jgi:hypothetical protein
MIGSLRHSTIWIVSILKQKKSRTRIIRQCEDTLGAMDTLIICADGFLSIGIYIN